MGPVLLPPVTTGVNQDWHFKDDNFNVIVCLYLRTYIFLVVWLSAVCLFQLLVDKINKMCLMSFRYLLRTPPRTYSPSDYRTFSQTQFTWLRCPAKMREMAAVTGATGVPTLPREHQRTVSFMAATSDYFHEVKSIWPLNTKWCPKTIEGLINLSHLNLNMSPKSLRPSLHSKSTTFSLTATVCAVSLITPQYTCQKYLKYLVKRLAEPLNLLLFNVEL